MAKVYMFPTKQKLPKNIEKDLHRIAKEYTETLFAALMLASVDGEFNENKMDEVNELVAEAYAEGLYKAAMELEGEL